jgi:energy-coupling factor transporter ATP-binding protein EcfA2
MNFDLSASFNARNYTPKEVAATFIPNSDYEDLWRNQHTVVLGPRGSGKTTLLKMLTLSGLYAWDHPMAHELRNARPFTAIYVPTDMHWHHQLKHTEEHLQAAPRFAQSASEAAVATAIFLATAKAFMERIRFEAPDRLTEESQLCEVLAREWQLTVPLPKLELVILSLKSRIGEIRGSVRRAIFGSLADEQLTDVPKYFHLDYFAQIDTACTAFDSLFRIKTGAKWALCLDELELAPLWLQNVTFSQQRSTEEQFLIKLSTSPLPRTIGTTESRPRQDFRLLCIWNHAGKENDDFPERLALSVLRRRFKRDVSPEQLFGRSEELLEAEKGVGKYRRGSAEWQLFKEVASWDGSFRRLLEHYAIDPDDPWTDDVTLRDTVLRKAKPVATFRRAFLKGTGTGRLALRSRKLSTIYFGKEAIYRITDGNPRRLIAILGDLCDRIHADRDGMPSRVTSNEQAEVLTRASINFSAYVSALPGGSVSVDGITVDLVTVLRTIGDFFRQRFLGTEFPLDPVGSFKVDSNINEKLIELLRLGVYHGAIVHIDPVPDTVETTLRGKRFRLSYMLAPRFRLPLNLYDSISLSRILRATFRLRVRRALPALVQQGELPLPAADKP